MAHTVRREVVVMIAIVVAVMLLAFLATEFLTLFSKHYDEQLSRVAVGMTSPEVKRIMGEPSEEQYSESRAYEVKTADGNRLPVVVAFDEDGRVPFVDGEAERMGIRKWMSMEEIESKLGTTKSSHYGYRRTWYFHGTRGWEWHGYIHFNEHGKVVAKSGWYD